VPGKRVGGAFDQEFSGEPSGKSFRNTEKQSSANQIVIALELDDSSPALAHVHEKCSMVLATRLCAVIRLVHRILPVFNNIA
jgi:hypothetical protein